MVFDSIQKAKDSFSEDSCYKKCIGKKKTQNRNVQGIQQEERKMSPDANMVLHKRKQIIKNTIYFGKYIITRHIFIT